MLASRHRRVLVVGVVAVVVAVAVVVGWPVYVDPRTDSPAPADAIVVLGGVEDARVETGLDLAEQGWAPLVLLSNPYKNQAPLNAECDAPRDFEVECFRPDPNTTLGEGRYVADLARENGWSSVIVVTMTPHVTRARDIVADCLGFDPLMVESRSDVSALQFAWQYVYQTAGFVRAQFTSC